MTTLASFCRLLVLGLLTLFVSGCYLIQAASGQMLTLVARHLALRLLELDLERARIDLGEQIARLDEVALAEVHRHQLAVVGA